MGSSEKNCYWSLSNKFRQLERKLSLESSEYICQVMILCSGPLILIGQFSQEFFVIQFSEDGIG